MATKAKKRKRRSPAGSKKKGGVMMGMRSSFKNVTHSVAGVGDEPQGKKKSSVVGTIITVALVLVAAVVIYKRFL
ncbi:MAG TPA: hypothetical protein VML75_23955 [Kofleriaceae bacterium]|jgi:hypothetical protein|nr:hypothetical protein [Kofleriaceae bacterium]